MKTVKIAGVNFGGGTGKTTTQFWFSKFLAQKEVQALIVDADPQGCLTAKLLSIPDTQMVEDVLGEKTLASVLEHGMSFSDMVRPAKFSEFIHVAGSDKYLIETMGRLVSKPGNNLFLRKALKREAYLNCPITLIDSAPDADMMIANILYAVDYIVIPATPEAKSVRGILTVIEMAKLIQADRLEESDGVDSGPTILGVVICDVARNAGHKQYVEQIVEIAGSIADTNGLEDDLYLQDKGAPVRGVMGVIPRYESKNAATDLWSAYVPTCARIYEAAGL